MKLRISCIIFFAMWASLLYGDNISISGIDTSGMIFDGKISLYLNITDEQGMTRKGMTPQELDILESIDNQDFTEREISFWSEGINEDKGINFELLIDNSGSMYDTVNGVQTDLYEETRIFSAISAIKTLINSMQGSKDKAGVALFNTYYKELVEISSNRNLVVESMQMIEEPGKDESFTELNAAVYSAAQNLSNVRGRKIIIVLSDGENYPYSVVRKEDSPQFGSLLYSTEDMINQLKFNSATLYAVNFGFRRDPSLEKVAIATGGYLYEAETEEDLKMIYNNIRERVLSEYYLEFNTDTEYSDRKFVKAQIKDNSQPSGTVYYFSGNLFGTPSAGFNWLYLLVIPFVLVLFIMLAIQKLSAPAEKAELEVTDYSGATQVFGLNESKTVIGNSDNDDITIVTEKTVEDNNATIIFDEKKSVYTLVSDKEVLVNNNPVKTRVLDPDDVLNINGATIIFNDKEE
ncbi:MAG: VWA domain-containing protein [Spirochaetaceae bacterium]|nr:VWA domain-containing protein [Spirochaetaceae bacterium]